MRPISVVAVLVTLAAATGVEATGPGDAPYGRAGKASSGTRIINVSMNDAMRFEPPEIRVRTGDTVRIVVTNKGRLRHEFVLGTMDELREHAEMMRKFGMEHHEPHMATVAPGGKATIVWQFTKPGTFHYACLEPGHLEAGMVGKVIVGGP